MEVLSENRNHVAFITLNRPQALNALSLEMIMRLRTLFAEYQADPEIYAVLIRGAGDKAFCAGGDIRALYHSFNNSQSLHQEFFAAEYPLDYQLYSYPKPYVVLMDGITLGGGMGIAQGSTFRIVSRRTQMAMPEVGIGFFPDVGASYFLSRLPGELGTYLALTGVTIRGADALYCGLADTFVEPEAIATLTGDLADLRWSDERFADVRRFIQARASRVLAPTLPALRAAIDAHFSKPTVLGILASLESETRSEYAGWARQTAGIIRGRSPTMVCVTFRQLRRAAALSLAACFRMELGMAAHSFEQGDFLEGVRAVLIDKDNAPRWRPSRIEEVTDGMVEDFFRERWAPGAHPLAALESYAAMGMAKGATSAA
ncbi:MAG TPA: enoyl-CoA hydratase/isomerase family protein [Steroidobacteraceae bacterium]|jgi:enoyl-CoA hydratase/carnithine racemase|nr:enoyl-CoA hydratase/isomerase family protein [Steroidobacteraceae bacterium]